jgi:hypothetical protein
MRRIVMLVTVALVMAAMMLAMAIPAFADKGGVEHAGSCGIGKSTAHGGIASPETPGASEYARESPTGPAGCAGKG